MSSRLCITPCGSAKIWRKFPNAGATEARYVYTGTFAKACHGYADRFFDNWMILSAKYGFLRPSDLVPHDYNVTFNKPSPEVVKLATLKDQTKDYQLNTFDEIVVVAGSKYAKMVRQVFGDKYLYNYPLSGCKGMGYMIQRLNNAISSGVEIE